MALPSSSEPAYDETQILCFEWPPWIQRSLLGWFGMPFHAEAEGEVFDCHGAVAEWDTEGGHGTESLAASGCRVEPIPELSPSCDRLRYLKHVETTDESPGRKI